MKKVIRFLIYVCIGLVLLISLFFGHRDRSVEELKDKYAQAPSAFMEVGGMSVHYRDEGNPRDTLPIVLLHGTGASLHTFDAWAHALKEDSRVIRMDLPGFGLTGPFPDRRYSIDHYVNFIASFLAKRGVQQCVLAGNSLGGQIAWNFALTHPEAVRKLVLIDAAGYPTKSTSVPIAFRIARIPGLSKVLTFITPRFVVESSVENVYADKHKISEALVDRYFELSLRPGNRQALVDRMQMAYDTSRVRKVPNIQQPTLILWGDSDGLIPLESAYRFQRDLPNDTLVVLNNSGHVPMEENPEESLRALMAFLEK